MSKDVKQSKGSSHGGRKGGNKGKETGGKSSHNVASRRNRIKNGGRKR